MSKFDPSARIPISNMSAYINSTPTAPLDPGTVEFVKGKPAITQPAEMTPEQFKAEARIVIKHMDSNCSRMLELAEMFKKRWREFGPTRDLACDEVFGCSLGALRHKINYWNEKLVSKVGSYFNEDEDKKRSLERIADLPDPLAELEAQMAKPAVHAGPVEAAEESETEFVAHCKFTPPCDMIGYPIPANLLERWSKRQEVQDRITAASRLRCALEEIVNRGHQNPLYGAYDWQGLIRTISQLQFHLGQCKPEVVCYECDGDFLKLKATKGGSGITRHCHACDDRGFMTKKAWEDYRETKVEAVQKRVKARLAKCKTNGD